MFLFRSRTRFRTFVILFLTLIALWRMVGFDSRVERGPSSLSQPHRVSESQIPISSPYPTQLSDEDKPVRFREMFYPIAKNSLMQFPYGRGKKLPKIQAQSPRETSTQKRIRIERQNVVKNAFLHAWLGYKKFAWGHDEVRPLTNAPADPFCVGLKDEFELARRQVSKIDFTKTSFEFGQVPLFETNIRYLGGLLGAYDLSHEKVFLEKAIELTDNILMWSFDTPNSTTIQLTRLTLGMPMLYFRASEPSYVIDHRAQESSVLSEIGSLQLEFTRLSQITGNMTYFDAVQRITNAIEQTAKDLQVPYLWPSIVNAYGCPDEQNCKEPPISLPDSADEQLLALGALADSFYEYLLKEYILLQGKSDQYRRLYEGAVESANKTLLFRPLAPNNPDVLLSGKIHIHPDEKQIFTGNVEHLSCFLGGMYGLGAKVLSRPKDLEIAIKLTEGCVWAYGTTGTGIMPEEMTLARCPSRLKCEWLGYLSHNREEIDERVYRGEIAPGPLNSLLQNSEIPIKGHRLEQPEDRQRRVFREKMRARLEAKNEENDQGSTIRRNALRKRSPFVSGPIDPDEEESDESVKEPRKDRSHRFPYEPDAIPEYYIKMDSSKYILRPEALESVFIMWRITGDQSWQEKGWQMIKAILDYTTTTTAHAAIENVMDPDTRQIDSMESFWLAETLKYAYLLFSDRELVTLDEYVFNTEAHPFKIR